MLMPAPETTTNAVPDDAIERLPLRWERRRPDQWHEVRPLWMTLEKSLGSVAVTCSMDWTESWLQHFGDLIPHQFGFVWRGERLLSVFLLSQDFAERRSWLPLRTWRMGTAGEPDRDSVCVEYNDWLCVPEERDAVLELIVSTRACGLKGDRLVLDGFAAVDLPDHVNSQNGWLLSRKTANYCDLRTVRESGAELISSFGDSTRKGIRQNLRDCGPVEVEWTENAAAAHAVFDDLIQLHQERWLADGQPGCYSSKRFTAFHRELIDRLVPAGKMSIVRVRANGVTLGCSQILLDRGRALVYQGGRIANSGKKSPGLITDYQCMLECLQRGYDAYDFMAGDSLHKRRMSTHSVPLVWAEYRWPGWRLPLYDALRSCKQSAKRWMKRSPQAEPAPPSEKAT